MKVNGVAFKKAREEIRKNAKHPEKNLRGEGSEGTQEWLAKKAKVLSKDGILTSLSIRTIQYLEKGNASIQVVDAVSPYLGIFGREYIYEYGEESVKLSSTGVVDFRPTIYPLDKSKNFSKSALLISIDPLILYFNSDDLDEISLNNATVKMKVGKLEVSFQWLYEVSLTPDGNGWLGIEKEIFPIILKSPEIYKTSIMFKQIDISKLNWIKFIEEINSCTDKLIKIDLVLDFHSFSKKLKIGISISQIREIINESTRMNESEYPFYLQPDALCW